MPVDLLPFDPSNKCVKCGHEIPEPKPEMIKQGTGPDAKMVPGPLPERQPPNVTYCDDPACLVYDGEDKPDHDEVEHMHAECQVCGYVWLTTTLDAGSP